MGRLQSTDTNGCRGVQLAGEMEVGKRVLTNTLVLLSSKGLKDWRGRCRSDHLPGCWSAEAIERHKPSAGVLGKHASQAGRYGTAAAQSDRKFM